MLRVIFDHIGRSRLPPRDLLERSVQVLHWLNPITLLCHFEDKMGASSEDLRGKAFINGIINLKGFKCGQEIVLQPWLKDS